MSNVCWGPWNTGKKPLAVFKDPDWSKKFHVWRMDWDASTLNFYVDDALWNTQDVAKTVTGKGNPFRQSQYMLLNLAIGGDWGGDPAKTTFPARLEVDYVRVFQKAQQDAAGAPATSATPPRSAPAKGDLVAHWRLDEGSGEAVPDSTGANAGEIVIASGAERVAGRIGGAMELKGSSYVKVPDSDSLDLDRELTVAAWIRLADAAGDQCVAAKGTNFVFCETVAGGRPHNVLNIGGGPTAHWLKFDYTKDAAFFLGRWRHVAFTYDGSKVVNYIDGEPDGKPAPLTGDMSTNWDWLGIGTNGPWADKFFKGAIDDVRIYKRALPPDEIRKLFADAPAK
jgi:hypothetical protein